MSGVRFKSLDGKNDGANWWFAGELVGKDLWWIFAKGTETIEVVTTFVMFTLLESKIWVDERTNKNKSNDRSWKKQWKWVGCQDKWKI
jgi:hypothetical protein